MNPNNFILSCRGLSKSFTLHTIDGRHVEALRGIDLKVEEGDFQIEQKPKSDWNFLISFQTEERKYTLFTNSYDTHQAWFYTLD